MMTRVAAMKAKLVENPVSSVAVDQSAISPALMVLPPNRSTRRPDRDQANDVHPEKRRKQVAHLDGRQTELDRDRLGYDRKRDSVSVIDRGQSEQKYADPQAAIIHGPFPQRHQSVTS
jgi:hypothetical protein